MSRAAGALIVFEGAEGAGKSTQLRRLAARLDALGLPHHAVREPGGTALGDAVRNLLLDPAREIAPRAEALLFMASRAELVQRELRPRLAAGEIVLVDRYFLSTYAYQVAGRGLPEAPVRAANALATDGLVPDLTLLLELPVGEGLARAAARGARDRMEGAGEPFHRRVAEAFAQFADPEWQRSHPEAGPVVSVDGAGDEAEVAARIDRTLVLRWPETFAPLLRSNTSLAGDHRDRRPLSSGS